MSDQKKMEQAFLNQLKHLLPDIYQYVIVADRGFGNVRFMNACIKLGFFYLVRTQDSWKICANGKETKIKFLTIENKKYENIILKNQKIRTNLIISHIEGNFQPWYIFTNLEEVVYEGLVDFYKKRFHCEKMFQDQKSSGFQMEDSKIQDKSRFKRLLFMIYVAQALKVFLGDYILENEEDTLKKISRSHKKEISIFQISNRLLEVLPKTAFSLFLFILPFSINTFNST